MAFPEPTPKQAKILWMSLTALATAIFLALIVLLLVGVGWVANRLATVLLPLAVAAIISYLLDPVVDWVELRYKLARVWAIVAVFAGVTLLVIGFVLTVAPQVIADSTQLIQDIRKKPSATQTENVESEDEAAPPETNATNVEETQDLENSSTVDQSGAPDTDVSSSGDERSFLDRIPLPGFVDRILTDEYKAHAINLIEENWKEIVAAILNPILNGLRSVASLTGFVIGFAMVPVFVFFFLLEEKKIVENWTHYLPIQNKKWKEEMVFIFNSINDALIVFFRGQVLVAMCLGVLIAIGFSIIGLKYALFLGVLAGVLSIIPYLGVLLSLFPALVIAFVQSQGKEDPDLWLPVLVLLVFVLVQMAEGLVISPKIIGDRVGMHPLTIIIAVLIGTTLMGGIVGGVLAIPLTAALRAILFRYVWKRDPAAKLTKPKAA